MSDVMFQEITGDNEPTVVESFCVNCEDNGNTTILLTKIPFFQEVILMSFYCEHCGYKNSEVQTGGKLKDRGVKYNLRLCNQKDLNRDIVQSEFATVTIPELELEIPRTNKKGMLNTVEGLIQNVIDGLTQDQEERQKVDPENAVKIDEFINRLKKFRNGEAFPFHLIIDDPSGNSFIKNPFAPNSDPDMQVEKYNRTNEQCESMGYSVENSQEALKQSEAEEQKEQMPSAHKHLDFTKPLNESLKEEALIFPTPCHSCGAQGENKMCTISIPYFKELVIMAFTCEHCGAKSREVKTGGEISDKAKRFTLSVESEDDLRRDLFKSETALFKIPELELELYMGEMGGIYSTVEGLLDQLKTNLFENNPFVGDSDVDFKEKMGKVIKALQECIELKRKFTMILDDPLGNSFIQNPYYPKADPRVIVEEYERTAEQNEELGLSDMNTEDYHKKESN